MATIRVDASIAGALLLLVICSAFKFIVSGFDLVLFSLDEIKNETHD